jgi:hypothetical protein
MKTVVTSHPRGAKELLFKRFVPEAFPKFLALQSGRPGERPAPDRTKAPRRKFHLGGEMVSGVFESKIGPKRKYSLVRFRIFTSAKENEN